MRSWRNDSDSVESRVLWHCDVQVVPVVEVVVWCEKLLEQAFVSHRTGQAIEGWVVRITSNVACEMVLDGQRMGAELEIMQVDCESVGVMTEASASRAPVGISS